MILYMCSVFHAAPDSQSLNASMLDENFFQCMYCSGKAFSKLMKKHKGLLRIDLRSNANGMSGVLEMLPKGSAKTATGLILASSGVLSEAQQLSQGSKEPTKSLFSGPRSFHGHDIAPRAVGDNPDSASAAWAVSSRHEGEQKGSTSVISHRPTRKGLVPMFTPDGQQQHSVAEPGKENCPTGNDMPAEPKGRSKAHKAKIDGSKGPNRAKLAGKALIGPKRVGQHSAACIAGFQFHDMARLQSQPTACLNHFTPVDEEEEEFVASEFDQGAEADAAAPSSSQHWQKDALQAYNPAHQNHAVGSATFGEWNRSCENGSQALSQSLLLSNTPLKFQHRGTAGIAGSARRTVSFQEHDATGGADRSRGQPENAVDLASDSAYIQGMSQAWREVAAAEDLGRQRAAAADFKYSLHQLGAPLTAYDAPESAAADALPEAAAPSAADLTEASADRKLQSHRVRAGSACPAGTRSARQSSGAAAQQGASHSRDGFPASFTAGQALFRLEASPSEKMSAGETAESYSANGREGKAAGSLTDQAAAAAAAMEAAKMNVWKAEVMCELEGLKCYLEGAAADKCRYTLTCRCSQARKEKKRPGCYTILYSNFLSSHAW